MINAGIWGACAGVVVFLLIVLVMLRRCRASHRAIKPVRVYYDTRTTRSPVETPASTVVQPSDLESGLTKELIVNEPHILCANGDVEEPTGFDTTEGSVKSEHTSHDTKTVAVGGPGADHDCTTTDALREPDNVEDTEDSDPTFDQSLSAPPPPEQTVDPSNKLSEEIVCESVVAGEPDQAVESGDSGEKSDVVSFDHDNIRNTQEVEARIDSEAAQHQPVNTSTSASELRMPESTYTPERTTEPSVNIVYAYTGTGARGAFNANTAHDTDYKHSDQKSKTKDKSRKDSKRRKQENVTVSASNTQVIPDHTTSSSEIRTPERALPPVSVSTEPPTNTVHNPATYTTPSTPIRSAVDANRPHTAQSVKVTRSPYSTSTKRPGTANRSVDSPSAKFGSPAASYSQRTPLYARQVTRPESGSFRPRSRGFEGGSARVYYDFDTTSSKKSPNRFHDDNVEIVLSATFTTLPDIAQGFDDDLNL